MSIKKKNKKLKNKDSKLKKGGKALPSVPETSGPLGPGDYEPGPIFDPGTETGPEY